MNYVLRKIKIVVNSEYCRVILPWFSFRTPTTPMQKVRWIAYHSQSLESRLLQVAYTLTWPLISIFNLIEPTWRYGSYVSKTYRVSLMSQIWGQFICSVRHNIAPNYYYKLRLFDKEKWAYAISMIPQYEITRLLPKLNKSLDRKQLGDKYLFSRNCQAKALPHPFIVAAFSENIANDNAEGKEIAIPPVDLVVKPSGKYGGLGIEIWRYNYRTDTWKYKHQEVGQKNLIQHCSDLSKEGTILLQQCVYNHPDLEQFSGKGVCTIRLVTCLTENAEVMALFATLRMPVGDLFTDNFSAGGIASPVNLKDGSLGVAMAKDVRLGIYEKHPDSKVSICGYRLPYWQETVELVLRAHRNFPDFSSVGWDIILSPEGPLLLEANLTWGTDIYQIPHGRSLEGSIFPNFFLSCLSSITST